MIGFSVTANGNTTLVPVREGGFPEDCFVLALEAYGRFPTWGGERGVCWVAFSSAFENAVALKTKLNSETSLPLPQ